MIIKQRSRSQEIVVKRVRKQLERSLQFIADDPIIRLSRPEAMALGEWADRDDLFERLNGQRSTELLALWDILGRLKHEPFVEFCDANYEALMERAHEEVSHARDPDPDPDP